ncbi:tetratricopeptide repeat protein [Pseudomonas gingeri]|uniref:Tetratricopeptide repeat protein n=1 Tax=Pseudomonas gingeri TaxID=117681 RepID=A0A7Y8CJS2_9PSED|nr:tetratricopeptide repeat protein [Pseudomonas gingeri]NWB26655.1 tetratricopeptide repeat protein [Pseudomonas gingeri]NWC32795.1 tetratricopeptide repeat protein [Pseudomonas gingeri]NWD52274.1 tetratricopeptide repeat protein [Pseudomonas gingeri]
MPKPFPSALLLLSSLLLVSCASAPDGSTGSGGDSYQRFMRLANDVNGRGDPGTAAALYEKATAQPGAGIEAWQKLGQARLDSGDARGAERAFQQGLELKRDDPAALLGLGTAQLREGKLDRAAVALTQAASALNTAQAYNRLGIAQVLRGQTGDAQAAFSKSLGLAPSDLDTQCNLALAYALGGKADQALGSIRQVSQSPRAQPRHQRNELLILILAGHEAQLSTLALDDIAPAEQQRLLVEARRIKAIADPAAQARELGLIDSH